jgi:hypothetical protein
MTTASDKCACVSDAGAAAEIASRKWEDIAARLTPIIGEGGFRSLYAHSVHLVQPRFPWLAGPDAPEQGRPFFAGLVQSLERQPPAVAAEAHRALVLSFTELLATFVGGALTSRLLQSSPPDDSADKPAQETSQ